MVHELLPEGKTNAITGDQLARILDVELRDITKQIEREREAGYPICAAVSGSDRGYYLAETPGELALYLKSLDRRLKKIKKTRTRLEAKLWSMVGQESLWIGDCVE